MSDKQLAVFSGKCLEGLCGTPAGFKDMRGTDLFVGDIVMIFTVTPPGEFLDYFPSHLTAVVSDEFTTYSDGRITRKADAPVYFPMGIKNVPMDSPGAWRVMRVKQFSEVVDGEHWSAAGFNYGPVPDALELKEQQP